MHQVQLPSENKSRVWVNQYGLPPNYPVRYPQDHQTETTRPRKSMKSMSVLGCVGREAGSLRALGYLATRTHGTEKTAEKGETIMLGTTVDGKSLARPNLHCSTIIPKVSVLEVMKDLYHQQYRGRHNYVSHVVYLCQPPNIHSYCTTIPKSSSLPSQRCLLKGGGRPRKPNQGIYLKSYQGSPRSFDI